MANRCNKFSWCSFETAAEIVIAYFCEDDRDELMRRQVDINKWLGIASLHLKNFYMQSRNGLDNRLIAFSQNGSTEMPFYRQIVNDIQTYKATVVILDNIAQIYGGDENNRGQVTQFMNKIHALTEETGASVLLLGHPAKADNSTYSGSTAWDACVRSRLHLAYSTEKEIQEDPAAEDIRILRHPKSNYSRRARETRLRWGKGVFEPIGLDTLTAGLTGEAHEEKIKEKFLSILEKMNDEGVNVSHASNAANYAPKVMAGRKDSGGYSKADFRQAMEALLRDGVIRGSGKPFPGGRGIVRMVK